MNTTKFTPKFATTITAALIIVACIFAVYLRLFTEKELWYEMFAAILGVIITAIITMILLRGQSNNDVQREKTSKVFEEKLRIYQEFLQTLYDVLKDNSILPYEEKMRLQFQTSYVAMHCDAKYIAKVSTSVRKLIEYKCSNKLNEEDPLLSCLFDVVEAFRKDLYGDDFSFPNEEKQNTLLNFNEAYANNEKDIINTWKTEGWEIEGPRGQDYRISLSKNGQPGVIAIDSKPQGLCFKASYPNEAEFAQPLQRQRGGYYNNCEWWKYFDRKYRNIPTDEFVERFYNDSELQHYVLSNFSQLKTALSSFQQTLSWKKEIGAFDNCELRIWYWNTLVCDFKGKDKEKEGTPYIDIFFADNNKVQIWIGNREHEDSKLKNTLTRIGKTNATHKDYQYLLDEIEISNTDSNESINANIVCRVKEWINKLR